VSASAAGQTVGVLSHAVIEQLAGGSDTNTQTEIGVARSTSTFRVNAHTRNEARRRRRRRRRFSFGRELVVQPSNPPARPKRAATSRTPTTTPTTTALTILCQFLVSSKSTRPREEGIRALAGLCVLLSALLSTLRSRCATSYATGVSGARVNAVGVKKRARWIFQANGRLCSTANHETPRGMNFLLVPSHARLASAFSQPRCKSAGTTRHSLARL